MSENFFWGEVKKCQKLDQKVQKCQKMDHLLTFLRMGQFSDIFSLSELKNLENLKMFLTSLRMTFHPRLRPPLTFTTPMPVRICTNPIISQNSILFLYVI